MVKLNGPITSEQIAEHLSIARATIRPDLTLLTLSGYVEARPKVGYLYVEKNEHNWLFEQINAIRVGDIKSTPVVVEEDTSLYDAIVRLFIEDTGSIFVMDKNRSLSGVISRKDFLKITIGGANIHQMPVSMAMTRMPNVIYVHEDESLYIAAKKIIEHQIDGLPIVQSITDENGKKILSIIGRITKSTITRIFIEMAE